MPSDPLEVLRLSASSARPNPQFAIALRHQLEEELGMTTTETITEPVDDTIRPPRLRLVHVRVANTERAVAFFGALFGWEAETSPDPHPDGPYRSAYVSNTDITMVLRDNPHIPLGILWFGVTDVAATIARVAELGGEVTSSALQAEGRGWAQCLDNQGVPFGVHRPGGSYARGTTTATAELGYLTIGVPDGDAGTTFYGQLFGWQFQPDPGHGYHHVENASIPLGLVGGQEPSVVLFFEVEDIEMAGARVVGLGGTYAGADESPSGLSASCTDDQGTRFDLWQPAHGFSGRRAPSTSSEPTIGYAVEQLRAAVDLVDTGPGDLPARLQRAWDLHVQNLWTRMYLPAHLNERFRAMWSRYTAPSDDRHSTALIELDDTTARELADTIRQLADDTAAAAARGERPAPPPTTR